MNVPHLLISESPSTNSNPDSNKERSVSALLPSSDTEKLLESPRRKDEVIELYK